MPRLLMETSRASDCEPSDQRSSRIDVAINNAFTMFATLSEQCHLLEARLNPVLELVPPTPNPTPNSEKKMPVPACGPVLIADRIGELALLIDDLADSVASVTRRLEC